MATAADFRRIVLGMRDTAEGAHMDHPDFRVGGRIFASLTHDESRGMVILTPEQQETFIREQPAVFQAESGAWGRAGCTRVQLAVVDEETLGEALTLAWQYGVAKGPTRPRAKASGSKSATTKRSAPKRRAGRATPPTPRAKPVRKTRSR